MNGQPWTSEELEFLRLTYGHVPARRIAAELGRSKSAVYTAARDQALGVRRLGPGNHKRPWTPYDIEFVRLSYSEIRTDTIAAHLGRTVTSVFGFAYNKGWRKSDRFYTRGDCGRTDGRRGEVSRFRKGHVPQNKGKKGWDAGGRSVETRFKKGNKPHTWKPVGTEVTTRDGYLYRKVSERGSQWQRWRPVHVLHWERFRGPVPRGMVLVFRNGDRTDIRIPNLELISRADLAGRNSIHNLPPQLKGAIYAKARLTREINQRARAV